MNLFEPEIDIHKNLLPFDGVVNYYGKIFTAQKANLYFDLLLNQIDWKNDEAIIFGKRIVTKRKVAWYGDTNFEYTYSKITKQALLWTPELLAIKTIVEKLTTEKYNSCLLNLYHNGNEGMGWHSDDEKELQKEGTIASVSFGAERKFMFKHKQNKNTISVNLEDGSLLTMKDKTQTNWLHQLAITVKIKTPRINLTFRNIANL